MKISFWNDKLAGITVSLCERFNLAKYDISATFYGGGNISETLKNRGKVTMEGL